MENPPSFCYHASLLSERILFIEVMNSVKSLRISDGLTYARFAALLFSAAFIVSGIFKLGTLPFAMTIAAHSAASLADPERLAIQSESIDSLTEKFSSHSLFYFPKGEEVVQGLGLEEMLRPYHLSGIIQGENPEALIQNQANQQTYFVRKGERFDHFEVTAIEENSIDVAFEGETKKMLLEEGIS